MGIDAHLGQLLALATFRVPPAGEWSWGGEAWAWVRVSGGIGYLLRKDCPSELVVGGVVLIRGGKPLFFRASQLSSLALNVFLVSLRPMPGVLSPIESRQLERLSAEHRLDVRLFPPTHEVSQLYAELCEIAGEIPTIVLRCRMLEIFGHVVAEDLAGPTAPAWPRANARKSFDQFVRKLPEAEWPGHSTADLARQCGCSERHFSRLFRETFGKSIRARQIQLRLAKAQQLLKESEAKIAEVALASGYRHLGLFNAVFKQHFGMTPTQWRSRHRNGVGKRPADIVTQTSPSCRQAATEEHQDALVLTEDGSRTGPS